MVSVGRALTGAAAGAALLLSPTAAAASDGDDLTARQLADQAKDNLLDATSVHLTYTDHSEQAGSSRNRPASMDLALDRDGNCAGSLSMGKGGGGVELVKRGDEVWMKPDEAFWKSQVPGGQGEAIAQLFGDRYIHGTTKDALLKGMAQTCDLSAFQKDVTGSGDGMKLTKGKETTRDGVRVFPLDGTEAGKKGTLYVTADAPHRLVGAVQKGSGTDVELGFSDYGKPVPDKTPPKDETVDVDKLRDQLPGA